MPVLTCWLLDTRTLWPGDRIEQAAPEYLNLLSPKERADVCRKVFIRDARMALGSALLKRFYVSKTLGISWSEIQFGRKGDPVHGKPCFAPVDGARSPLDFNVSHQAGLVALVGYASADVEVGVDVVCVNERDDYRVIDNEGFEAWVDIYAEIFSEQEMFDMKYGALTFALLDGVEVSPEELGRHDRHCTPDEQLTVTLKHGEQRRFSSSLLVDAKLRRFYAYWCCKEAYIKLVGEGLLAEWIQQLEFRNVQAPKAGTIARCSTHGCWGERVDDVELWLHGNQLGDVKLELQAFEESYIIGLAMKPAQSLGSRSFPPFEQVALDDILQLAQSKT